MSPTHRCPRCGHVSRAEREDGPNVLATNAGLALVEVTEADGWTSRIDDDSSEEIEVEFRRDNVTRDIEIEWNGSRLEIDIDTGIDGAESGVYDIGNAGSFEFTLAAHSWHPVPTLLRGRRSAGTR